MAIYDRIGAGYGYHRRPEPRWATRISAAIGGARRVINVGAGTGSYEPERGVVAAEPSRLMIAQRPLGAAPVVGCVAEALPFADNSFDVALALMTVHHWTNVPQGLSELRRVAPRQVVSGAKQGDRLALRTFFTNGQRMGVPSQGLRPPPASHHRRPGRPVDDPFPRA